MELDLREVGGVPKYLRLKKLLKKKIVDSNRKSGDRFYSEREIMRRYSISSSTVSRAMRELVCEGLVIRKVGGGSFISENSLKRDSSINVEGDNGHASRRDLAICVPTFEKSEFNHSLNWFILSKIQKGIINTCQNKTNIYSPTEYLKELKTEPILPAILINPAEEVLAERSISKEPFIVVDQIQESSNCPRTVSCDHMEGVYHLIKYLALELGHKKIAIITSDNSSHCDRLAAYQISLRVCGIEYQERFVLPVEFGSLDEGYQAAHKLLSHRHAPTAIFADTDLKAQGAIRAAHDLGLRVPEDVSIAGFDDIPETWDSDSPPLTTVRLPYLEMGVTAARLLENKINNPKEHIPKTVLKTELVVRETCARRKT